MLRSMWVKCGGWNNITGGLSHQGIHRTGNLVDKMKENNIKPDVIFYEDERKYREAAQFIATKYGLDVENTVSKHGLLDMWADGDGRSGGPGLFTKCLRMPNFELYISRDVLSDCRTILCVADSSVVEDNCELMTGQKDERMRNAFAYVVEFKEHVKWPGQRPEKLRVNDVSNAYRLF